MKHIWAAGAVLALAVWYMGIDPIIALGIQGLVMGSVVVVAVSGYDLGISTLITGLERIRTHIRESIVAQVEGPPPA